MKVLAIDDDEQIRRLLSLVLASAGLGVETASDGESGIQAAIAGHPDIILLDLAMPGLEGAQVLARLRSWTTVPVIILSVRDSESEIARLLDSGADDYIVKPFHSGVLISRIKAVYRRSIPETGGILTVGRLEIDFERRRAAIGGQDVRLTPLEFSIVSLLARNAGRIVTRTQLLREVWGPLGELEEGSLRVHISSIRKKTEEDPSSPGLLLTEPGIGYRLAVPE
jgi:two-component system KDP operon response regulator KdpE